jgi:hypothetical protein
MTDLRHLLAIYVHAHQTGNSLPPHIDAEARAALAQLGPQGATDEALASFTSWFCRNYPGPDTIIHKPEWHAPKVFRAAMSALIRWGRPAIEPVPVAERPWEREEWCDAKGQCWMGDGGGGGFVPSWRLCKPSDSSLPWSLPHHALPVPQQEAE